MKTTLDEVALKHTGKKYHDLPDDGPEQDHVMHEFERMNKTPTSPQPVPGIRIGKDGVFSATNYHGQTERFWDERDAKHWLECSRTDSPRPPVSSVEGHTKGPWLATSVGLTPDGRCRIVYLVPTENQGFGNAVADSRLISRAPELLEQVRELREAMAEILGNAGYLSGEAEPTLRELNVHRAFLDKARSVLARTEAP